MGARHGRLGSWLDSGIAIIEQQCWMGGSLGQYALNADSLGGTFLECLDGSECEAPLLEMRTDPVTRELGLRRNSLPPLELVGRFQRRLGAALQAEILRHPRSRMLTGTRAISLHLEADGSVTVLATAEGQRITINATTAIMALGGRQNMSWETIGIAPGICLGCWQDRIIASDVLLSRASVPAVMRQRDPPRAIILGGAHSAFSAAWLLLERIPGLHFGSSGVRILYRSEPKVMYSSREAARGESYRFSEADVCQATGRVHRLGGLRGDGREIWRRMHGLADTGPDKRVIGQRIQSLAREELISLLDNADLIVPALGYRMATVPVFDANGDRIPLARTGPSVGPDSRLLAADGSSIPNVFGIGLGSGFVPWGDMAGERSFAGQQNSLWLCQNGLGEMIYHGARKRTAATSPSSLAAREYNGNESEKGSLAPDPGVHQADMETMSLTGGRGHRSDHLLR